MTKAIFVQMESKILFYLVYTVDQKHVDCIDRKSVV